MFGLNKKVNLYKDIHHGSDRKTIAGLRSNFE